MKIRQMTICHTCRSRKLACDGVVPWCSQCVKSGRVCAGYQHDLIFRPSVVPSHHQTPIRTAKRRSFFSSAQQKTQSVRGFSNLHRLSAEAEIVEHRRSEQTNTLSPPLSWPLLDIISLVVQNFSPFEPLEQTYHVSIDSAAQRVCGAWVEVLPELARDAQMERFLSPAIKTLAVSILSQGYSSRAPVPDALAAYASAMSSLRFGLSDMKDSNSNVFAAASMCLLLSEVLLPTSKAGGLIHAKGIGDLLQLHGPEFYSTGVGHRLFVGFRPILFIDLFQSRQNAFLAEDQWLIAPFSLPGPTPLQTLFSELASLPLTTGIVEAIQSMPAGKAEAAVNAAFRDLRRSLHRVLRLSEDLKNHDEDQYRFSTCAFHNRTSLRFLSITAANYFTHAWALHILCAQHIDHLVSLFPHLSGEVEPCLEKLINRETVIRLACLIFRSTEFLTLEKLKLCGAASTMLPLYVGRGVLKGQGKDDEELRH